jgi:hypothetical protein
MKTRKCQKRGESKVEQAQASDWESDLPSSHPDTTGVCWETTPIGSDGQMASRSVQDTRESKKEWY